MNIEAMKLALEAGCKPFRSPEHWDDVQVFSAPDVLERFVALVAAAEREACAKVCEGLFQQTPPYTTYAEAAQDCAAAIRARGQA